MPVTGGWQHRLDGLPTQPVQRPALFAVELVRHLPQPRGLGFLHRRPGPARAEVVAAPPAFRSRRCQSLDAVRFERRHFRTVGIAVVRQNRLGPAQFGRDRRDVRHQLVAVAGAGADPRAHDQLRAPGIHNRLGIVGLSASSLPRLPRPLLLSGLQNCRRIGRPIRLETAARCGTHPQAPTWLLQRLLTLVTNSPNKRTSRQPRAAGPGALPGWPAGGRRTSLPNLTNVAGESHPK